MEQLKNELAKLVYDYSINRKYADKKFVDKALTLCINAFDINDYVRKPLVTLTEEEKIELFKVIDSVKTELNTEE